MVAIKKNYATADKVNGLASGPQLATADLTSEHSQFFADIATEREDSLVRDLRRLECLV
jgi:hypothetical protein